MTSKKYTTWGEFYRDCRHVPIDFGRIEAFPHPESPYEPVHSDSGKPTSIPKSRSGPPVKAEKPTVAPPLPQEMPLVGLEKIAQFMNLTLDQVKRISKELQRQAIFIRQLKGKPPNRRPSIIAYPSSLKSYMENQSKQKK